MDRLFRLPKPEPKPVPKPKPEPPAPAENYGLLLEEMAAAPQEQLTTNAPSLGALAMGAERPEQGFPWELPAPEVRHTLDAGPILPLLGLILVLAVALFLRSRRS